MQHTHTHARALRHRECMRSDIRRQTRAGCALHGCCGLSLSTPDARVIPTQHTQRHAPHACERVVSGRGRLKPYVYTCASIDANMHNSTSTRRVRVLTNTGCQTEREGCRGNERCSPRHAWSRMPQTHGDVPPPMAAKGLASCAHTHAHTYTCSDACSYRVRLCTMSCLAGERAFDVVCIHT